MNTQASPIDSDSAILGGTPVFAGTRAAVQSLFEYLKSGDRLDDFLADFPSVSSEQAVAAFELAGEALGVHASSPFSG